MFLDFDSEVLKVLAAKYTTTGHRMQDKTKDSRGNTSLSQFDR